MDKKDVSSIYAFCHISGHIKLAMPLGIQTIIGFALAGSISTSIVILIFLVVAAVLRLVWPFTGKAVTTYRKIQQKLFVRYSLSLQTDCLR